MFPLWVLGAGQFLSTMGQMQGDAAQGAAERDNAYFFREQAQFQKEATDREIAVFRRKAAFSLSTTIGNYTKSGVSLSADALSVIAGQKGLAIDEENAIQREGDFRARLALLRGAQADQTADSLTSPTRMFTNIASGTLNFAGNMYKG